MGKWWLAAFVVVGFGMASTIAMIAAQNSSAPLKVEKSTNSNARSTSSPRLPTAGIPAQASNKVLDSLIGENKPKPPAPILPTPRMANSVEATTPRRLPSKDEPSLSGSSIPVTPANPTVSTKIRREGTELIDVVGVIRRQGNRLEFAPIDGSAPMTILENQLLQRIDVAANSRSGANGRWTVSGTVTEYRNINYLMVSRAFYNQ